MARPLRIERPGGRYHVTAHGNEQRRIFRQDADRLHFLELLAELGQRFGARVHAYVLMDNHFHLLLETPEANLSRAMQWLGVSYSVWHNRRHNRTGHLFQGRFRAVVVEDDAGWQEVARYTHLNPVRVAGLGPDQRRRAAGRAGVVGKRRPGVLAERLRLLREFRWSSYRGYAGYGPLLGWVWREPLGRLCVGRTVAERRAALREYTEQPVREGAIERPWDRLVARVVLGSEAFARRLRREVGGNRRGHQRPKGLSRPVAWGEIVSALERAKGERWAEFSGRYGDWGRDAALWLGRRQGRLTLGELGRLAGGMDYAAVGQAVSRFGRRLAKEARLRHRLRRVESQL